MPLAQYDVLLGFVLLFGLDLSFLYLVEVVYFIFYYSIHFGVYVNIPF
jgi:hypothetical protein